MWAPLPEEAAAATAEPPGQMEPALSLPEPMALRCRFEPLTGEVCIEGGEEAEAGRGVLGSNGKRAPRCSASAERRLLIAAPVFSRRGSAQICPACACSRFQTA